MFVRPGVAAGHVRRDQIAVGEVAAVDGEGAAVRQAVDGVKPALRVPVGMDMEPRTFVGDEMAADAAAFARSQTEGKALAHIASAAEIQEKTAQNAPEQNQPHT